MDFFKPTRPDGKSYREVAVEALKDLEYGTVLNYSTLGKALDINHKTDRQKIQAVVRLANVGLLKLYKRGLENVKNVGYRIIEPKEHMIVANGHQAKADRAMVAAIRFYNGADLSKMTESERKLHHGQHMLAEAIYASHTHLDKRIKRIEDLLQGTATLNE
jgi:hypothetical protein